MQGVMWAALGTGFTFFMTAAGAALVFLFGKRLNAAVQSGFMGFAGGVMSAAAVFSLLVPAVEAIEAAGKRPALAVTAGFCAGAGLMIAADALALRRQRAGSEAQRRQALMLTAVTLHNVPEGMAVGLAFASAAQGGAAALAAAVTLALGIGLQNVPEGAAVSLPLRSGGMSRMRSFFFGAASGAVEPVCGVLVVLAAAAAEPLLPGLMAFAAGAMMLVTVTELIPQALKSRCGALCIMTGYALMMALDIALG